jgi:CRP/FNR family transcriptional regulator, anaerobic regulatory protein
MQKVADFFSSYKSVLYKKGEVIIRSDEEIREIFYLKSGSVKMSVFSEEGREVILHIFKPLAFFPMMISLNSSENNYSFEAVDDVEVLVAPASDVVSFVKAEPEVLFDLASRFSSALIGLSRRIEEMTTLDAYTRIVSLFVYLAEKFGEKNEDGVRISLMLNHQDIASWIGIQRETASRQIEKLQQKGLLMNKDHYFIIPSLDQLMDKTHL